MTLVLAALLVATPEEQLQTALAAYGEGHLERALALLGEVAESATSSATRSQAHLARGLCFGALQQFDRIAPAFEAALMADPEAKLDPRRVQPALIGMLDAARSRLQGKLTVTRADSQGRVLVDGVETGRTPLTRDVSVGRHVVEVVGDDGRTDRREVTVRAREALSVVIAVKPPPAPAASLNPLIEVRGTLDPRDLTTPHLGPAPEITGGIGARHWAFTGGFLIGGAPAALLRGTGRLPLGSVVALEASVQGVLFFSQPIAPSLAGLAGASFSILGWLEGVVSVGGGWIPNSALFRPEYVMVNAGVRFRIFGVR